MKGLGTRMPDRSKSPIQKVTKTSRSRTSPTRSNISWMASLASLMYKNWNKTKIPLQYHGILVSSSSGVHTDISWMGVGRSEWCRYDSRVCGMPLLSSVMVGTFSSKYFSIISIPIVTITIAAQMVQKKEFGRRRMSTFLFSSSSFSSCNSNSFSRMLSLMDILHDIVTLWRKFWTPIGCAWITLWRRLWSAIERVCILLWRRHWRVIERAWILLWRILWIADFFRCRRNAPCIWMAATCSLLTITNLTLRGAFIFRKLDRRRPITLLFVLRVLFVFFEEPHSIWITFRAFLASLCSR